MSDFRETWVRVEDLLRAALAAVDLGDPGREWVEEYLDHNELGLAFEVMVETLVVNDVDIEPEARKHFAAAASQMGLEDNPFWQRL